MKRPWTRSEKWLWATPLLLGVVAAAFSWGTSIVRRTLGWPQQLDTHANNVLAAVVLSRDGSILAATGRDVYKVSPLCGTVYLWNARTLSPLKPFAPQFWKDGQYWRGWNVHGLSLSPDGKLIGMDGRGGGGYAVYEVTTQKLLWRTRKDAYDVCAHFSDDGRFVATGNFELREARTGRLQAHWTANNGSLYNEFALSPDAKVVAWIGAKRLRVSRVAEEKPLTNPGKAIEIRKVSDGKILAVLSQSQGTESVCFSRDGKQIVSQALYELSNGFIDGGVVRCHAITGQLLWQHDFRRSTQKGKIADFPFFSDAIFSPDGKRVAVRESDSSGKRNRVFILDASNGSVLQQIKVSKDQNTNYSIPPALAFSPDGQQLFVRGGNAVVVLNL